MSFQSRERAEQIEIEAAANWAKAKAGFRWLGFALKIVGAAIALSFAYYSGERDGLHLCYGASAPK